MADIRIESESDQGEGWEFIVAVHLPTAATRVSSARGRAASGSDDDAERSRRLRVTLSWVDYDYWCGGTRRPDALVEDVVRLVLDRLGSANVPDRFDASTVRRWIRDADDALRGGADH